ncbi:MAG: DUF4169 family protein [Nannocystaceae bacterium]|nr:DUF4169 family protein [Nannocystaceae bacterium]
MADVVNLNHARKRKARKDAREQGDANAVRFGRSKADREGQSAQAALDAAKLDGARRIRTEEPPEDESCR